MPRALLLATLLLVLTSLAAPWVPCGTASAQNPTAERSIEDLLADIREHGDKTKPAIFEALAKKGGEEAYDALLSGAEKIEKYGTLYWAYRALRHFKGDEKLAAKAIAFLERGTLGDVRAVSNAAAYAIREFGVAGYPSYERIVRRASNNHARSIVVGALVPLLVERVGPDDLDLLLDNFRVGASGAREVFLEALPKLANPRGLSIIESRLKGGKSALSTKQLIVAALAPVEDDRVDALLVTALRSKVTGLQLAAIESLRQRGYTRHTRELEKLVRSDDVELRSSALVARAAVPIKAGTWVKRILKMARAKDAFDRETAAMALAGLDVFEGDEDVALETLHGLFDDEDEAVRRTAFASAEKLRRKASLPLLMARLAEEQGVLLDALHLALLRLSGEDHGKHPGRWEAWWRARGEAFAVPSLEVAEARHKERERRRRAAARTSFYGLKIGENNVYFVLDASGSMAAKNEWDETRLEVAQQEVEGALKRFEDGKSFNVLFFGTDLHPWRESLVEMDKKAREEATAFVKKRAYAGGTAIYDALKRAFDDPDMEAIYVLSDGAPSGGTTDDIDEIRAAVAEWNAERAVKIHCISVGQRHRLLVDLAADSGGEFREVD